MTEAAVIQTAESAGIADTIYTWGLSVISFFQSFRNPALDAVMRFFTELGGIIPYVLLLSVIFWCVDEKRGFKLAMTVFISNGVNTALKNFLRVPRPYTQDSSVLRFEEKGFSTPSGHAQNSAAFWPTLLFSEKKDKPRKKEAFAVRLLVSILLPLIIGLSRIYFGVHYPSDVIFGWALGALISVMALFVVPALASKLKTSGIAVAFRDSYEQYRTATGKTPRMYKFILPAIASLVLVIISGGDSSMGGMLLGFSAGYILLTGDPAPADSSEDKEKNRRFSAANGSVILKVVRTILGLLLLAGLYYVLKKISPAKQIRGITCSALSDTDSAGSSQAGAHRNCFCCSGWRSSKTAVLKIIFHCHAGPEQKQRSKHFKTDNKFLHNILCKSQKRFTG
ncbi:phosphatase PAP2 family protein [Brucepastera parasyntrophica]|uniref:phosphatase PAP2 family protein n=1 Tax=Brucepastera parasyntrophica TaxID=2880008 RepID=UPI00210AC47B|nr:phosphatase PAP2 family protein [Brucepastera parasyntrophica]ULQ59017.1 phosphatase PAP2 family protein [Brucepastera parasyntrophica]